MPSLSLAALRSVALRPTRLLRDLQQMLATAQSRRALRRLDEHLLRDIGLTRHEAEVEAGRTPWDAPLHWLR